MLRSSVAKKLRSSENSLCTFVSSVVKWSKSQMVKESRPKADQPLAEKGQIVQSV